MEPELEQHVAAALKAQGGSGAISSGPASRDAARSAAAALKRAATKAGGGTLRLSQLFTDDG